MVAQNDFFGNNSCKSQLIGAKNVFFVENDPLSDEFRNSALKEFMMTPAHVLGSNFMEVGCWEVGETMRCLGDKTVQKCCFLCPPPDRLRVKCHAEQTHLSNFLSAKQQIIYKIIAMTTVTISPVH